MDLTRVWRQRACADSASVYYESSHRRRDSVSSLLATRASSSVTPDPRFRSSYVLAIALVLGACHSSSGDPASLDAHEDPDTASTSDEPDTSSKHRDAGPPDAGARPSDAMRADGSTSRDAGGSSGDAGGSSGDAGGSSGGDAGAPGGAVSCYSAGSPNTTCSLPTHCCFTNYSSQHDGECTASTCTWGTIECDGPEDCASGQHCCAHAIIDPEDGLLGYRLACQTSACGAAPVNQELCHPTTSSAGTCSGPRACIPALGNDNDLPRSLYICR